MKLRLFFSLLILVMAIGPLNSFARKPAVEDFVGVETENYKPTTKGTEVMFNFGNHITSHQKQQKMNIRKQQKANSFATFVLAAFVLLPFFMWFAITRSVNKVQVVAQEDNQDDANAVDVDNIAHLSDYKNDDDNDDDDVKKAS